MTFLHDMKWTILYCCIPNMYVCSYTWMYIRTYIYTYTSMYIHTCMHTYILGLSDHLSSTHYHDSLRLFVNKIVDCLTIPIVIFRVHDNGWTSDIFLMFTLISSELRIWPENMSAYIILYQRTLLFQYHIFLWLRGDHEDIMWLDTLTITTFDL